MSENNEFYLPKLYAIDKKNLVREWEIKVVNHSNYSEIIINHGTMNGKQIKNITKFDKGKNIGKKNETTHYQQALSEAKSKWTKKKDIENYTTTIPQTNEENNNVNLSPMLAHEYKKHKDKLNFPCFIQKKYDGYRMLYDNKTENMYSRNGKKYDALYNTVLHQQLKKINIPLDGEIYCHDPSITFESYGILRKKKITNDDMILLNKLEYHVYDINISNMPYYERYELLKKFFTNESFNFTNIKLVDTFICNNENDIKKYHESFVNLKYEGSIIRNKNGLYVSKRSFDLLKYKDFDDSEFEIIDFTFENDNTKKLIVWICKTKDNKIFNIRPQGTKSERELLFKEGNKFIGQFLWVKFFGYTENDIPRFPVTKTNSYKSYIRNCIE